MLAACELTGGTNVAAGTAALTTTLFDTLIRTMIENGASLTDPVVWASPKKKQQLTKLYEVLPAARNVGGANITTIVTDFGNVGIAPAHRMMVDTSLLLADMAYIQPVTQPVPDMGNMFYEALAKTGASEKGQLFGQIGLDHGPAFMHGKISGLTA
jgi:hypothetical protein